mgnify:CR=1 FL=1
MVDAPRLAPTPPAAPSRQKAEPDYLVDVQQGPVREIDFGGHDDLGSDELIDEAKEVILQAGKASASLLQRRLRVGYARAARILDILEDQAFVGPAEGSKPREVLGGIEEEEELTEEEALH